MIVARGLGRDVDVLGAIAAFGLGRDVLAAPPLPPSEAPAYASDLPRRERRIELRGIGGLRLSLRLGGVTVEPDNEEMIALLMAAEITGGTKHE